MSFYFSYLKLYKDSENSKNVKTLDVGENNLFSEIYICLNSYNGFNAIFKNNVQYSIYQ